MSWAPLASYADAMLLVARLLVGVVMVYYGWPKLRDPGRHFKEFQETGFKPAPFWGSIILVVEFFGGLAMLLGVVVWAAAALFGFEMLMGTIWKITKARKPFTDYSYDLQLLALCLLLLTFGPGAAALSR
jgi:uncharacterized membrane protein YphA (DoxX/SURF4 family)